MNEIQYIGERLWVGQLGHFFIVLSFVSSLVSIVSYYFAEKRKDSPEGDAWKRMGRYAFLAHGISVFAIIGLVFYIMTGKMYEYAYAFNHVSDDLSNRYLLSAFWEGQEGSFLLWMFWHVVLGMVLLARSKSWENGVMLFLCVIQAVLGSLLLGVYLGATKIGINPFVLLRETPNMMEVPIFQQADYLSKISGSGLNPLLQNYWMTIHPPTLFLGFASVLVPFCYAAAGLWTKRYKEWLTPVLPWALFSAGVLGLGILMGGAWAYEALSFGGYWAWDPVENMSLVPWLILIAGLHMNVVSKATGHSLVATFTFYMLAFVFIFYSTFLTRSGILGETSVHAFTELGLEWHLVLGLGLFAAIPAALLAMRYKSIPKPEKEEPLASKEFWMFIGALVFLISSLLITLSTSIPVFNKILDATDWLAGEDTAARGILIWIGETISRIPYVSVDFSDLSTLHRAPPAEPVAHYNKYQLWVAVFIGLLSGGAQFLRYREKDFGKHSKNFLKHTGIAAGLSLALTVGSAAIINMNAWQYYILTFACWYAVVSNLDYTISVARGNLKMLGSALSHIGFGLMIIGSVISGLNKHHISTNTFAQRGLIEGFSEEDYERNILLIKGRPMLMKGYEVTYSEDSISGVNRTFKVDYRKKDMKTGAVTEEFSLYPNILYDKTFTKVAASNPSTKRYWDKDVFTHIASLPRAETDREYARAREDSLDYVEYKVVVGDTFGTEKTRVRLLGIDLDPKHKDYARQAGDNVVGVDLEITDTESGETRQATAMGIARGATRWLEFPAYPTDLQVKARITQGIFGEVFVDDSELDYKTYTLQDGGTFTHNGVDIRFAGFRPNPVHPHYFPEANDQAFYAALEFEMDGERQVGKPIYCIRGRQPLILKDEVAGMHFKIANLDPQARTLTILAAYQKPEPKVLTIRMAEDVPSGEYIVLEAIVFPGINLFWLGSLMMLFGLFAAMWKRWRGR